jgi:hypothetical protein
MSPGKNQDTDILADSPLGKRHPQDAMLKDGLQVLRIKTRRHAKKMGLFPREYPDIVKENIQEGS